MRWCSNEISLGCRPQELNWKTKKKTEERKGMRKKSPIRLQKGFLLLSIIFSERRLSSVKYNKPFGTCVWNKREQDGKVLFESGTWRARKGDQIEFQHLLHSLFCCAGIKSTQFPIPLDRPRFACSISKSTSMTLDASKISQMILAHSPQFSLTIAFMRNASC